MKIPDMSLCVGTGCNKKESCVRFLTPSKEKYQAWLVIDVAVPDRGNCKFYAGSFEDVLSK